uniref:DUF632 domain-containing protein n=1 Tax=Triticum urartu TaxID=4572 RepID=A0A8R7QW08_TRIUA
MIFQHLLCFQSVNLILLINGTTFTSLFPCVELMIDVVSLNQNTDAFSLLLDNFARARKVMVDSHEEERQIMFVRFSFVSYVSAQKAYIEALDGWLSKFILTDTICYSRGISLIAPDRAGTPPLVVITSGTPCCRRLDRSSSLVTPA